MLVQTLAPEARAIAFASGHDTDGFLADELAPPRALGYPPFASLIRIVCSAPEEAPAAETAAAIAARAAGAPAPCSGRRRCFGSAAARAASWYQGG